MIIQEFFFPPEKMTQRMSNSTGQLWGETLEGVPPIQHRDTQCILFQLSSLEKLSYVWRFFWAQAWICLNGDARPHLVLLILYDSRYARTSNLHRSQGTSTGMCIEIMSCSSRFLCWRDLAAPGVASGVDPLVENESHKITPSATSST